MTEAAKEFNVDIINETRTKAFNLSDSDKIGSVIQKGMDVLLELTRDGDLNPERLKNAVSSLKSERELVYEFDDDKDDSLRKGIYGVMEAFETAFGWYAEREEKLIAEAKVKKEEAKDEGDADGKSLCEVSDSGVGVSIKEEDDDARTVKMEIDADGEAKNGKSKEAMRAEKKTVTPRATKKVKEEKNGEEAGTSKGKGAKRAADDEGKKTPKRTRKSAGDKDMDDEDEEMEETAKTPKGTEKKIKPEKTTPTKNTKENDDEIKVVETVKKATTQRSMMDFLKKKN